MNKKAFCAAAAAVFLGVFSVAASATSYGDVDMSYSGVLGSYYEAESAETGEKNPRIQITPDISYSGSEKLYYYRVSDIATPFTSNVMDGMITSGAVDITSPVGIDCELYRDGVLCDGAMTGIRTPGAYVLRVKSNSGVSLPVLAFTVVGASAGFVSGYTMPEGFSVTGVVYNGESVSYRESFADLSADGDYKVEYRCGATGAAYSLTLTVDHTPPELKLEALKDGKAWGPVDISDVEPGGSVAVYRNGEEEKYTSVLTKSGQYELVVSDAAGNKTSYAFTIMIYFNSGTLVFCIAVAAIIAGVAVYVLIARKKLRVR